MLETSCTQWSRLQSIKGCTEINWWDALLPILENNLMQAGQDDRWREAGPCTSTIHWRDWHSVPGRRNFLPVVSLTPPQRWDKAGERNSRQTHMLSPTGLIPLLTSAFNLKPYYKGLRNSLHLFILLLPFLPKYIQKPGFTSQVLQSCKMKRNWCLEKNGGAPLVSSETSSASLLPLWAHRDRDNVLSKVQFFVQTQLSRCHWIQVYRCATGIWKNKVKGVLESPF